MNKGIGNFEIAKFFKEEDNEGTFSIDSITKYIYHKK